MVADRRSDLLRAPVAAPTLSGIGVCSMIMPIISALIDSSRAGTVRPVEDVDRPASMPVSASLGDDSIKHRLQIEGRVMDR